jgi:hypothetical protein
MVVVAAPKRRRRRATRNALIMPMSASANPLILPNRGGRRRKHGRRHMRRNAGMSNPFGGGFLGTALTGLAGGGVAFWTDRMMINKLGRAGTPGADGLAPSTANGAWIRNAGRVIAGGVAAYFFPGNFGAASQQSFNIAVDPTGKKDLSCPANAVFTFAGSLLAVPMKIVAGTACRTRDGLRVKTPVRGIAPEERRPPLPPTLSDRPHLLELANGVVIQVDGFWLEAGEIRFRRLGGVVGFALNEIARLLPQETEPVRGRLPARFVRQLGPDRVEVQLREGVKRVRLIGIDPIASHHALEDPWAALDRGILVYLEFDRERSGGDGDWLAYLYLPNGRMFNAELIRVGLAEPRAEAKNIRYLDLFQEIQARR